MRLRFDLLAWTPLRAVVLWAAFPFVLQVGALAVVVWLAANGLGIGADARADALMTLRKTNLTTLVVWGLWWPGLIAVALIAGRAWCTACPLELVSRIGHAVGRMVWSQTRLGSFLRAGWFTVITYLVLQFLVAGIALHRVPHFTALLLLALVAAALGAGFLFREERSFCKAFCPAAALLSVYGRTTPLQLEARDPAVCERCESLDCVRGEHRARFDRRSCPSMLRPYQREASDGCVLCLQCVKVCPHANMGFGLVAADAPVRRKRVLRPFEAAFVAIALGFVTHELTAEVKWFDVFFHAIPAKLNTLAPSVPFGWFEATWFLLVFPLSVWTAIAGAGYVVGHRTDLRALLLAAATGAAPVVAVAHLAKAAAKVSAWSGFLPLALRDPRGLDMARQLDDRSLAPPAAALGLSVLGWAMIATILVIAWMTARWLRQLPQESRPAARTGLAASVVLFAFLLCVWSVPAP